MADDFSARYGDLLTGSYGCVDRIVLNAYFSLGHNPGGFRCWWRRLHDDCDEQLDNTHLMRFAGRFARRLKAWGNANGVPVIYCKAGERKHLIAEEYLAAHEVGTGVFLVLAAKAPASVWEVSRSESSGLISKIAKKTTYVNHYSFHIMDPQWGHVTVKMSGHPPFPAQVILNGHEYVAAAARAAGIGFAKEGNCFTGIADPQGLARVADTLSRDAAIGRLGQVCDRWIYSACLCFGLDLADQARSGFRYSYSIYQAEYSRNLLFASGAQMEDLFDRILDRTRSRLDIPALRTLFGLKNRPHHNRASGPPAQEAVIEKPQYGLTWFRIRFPLSAALALAAAPHGFTVAEHAARVQAMTGHDGYTIRQAAYDLRKLRGKRLVIKPGRTRRYQVPPHAARTIAAMLTLRDQVIVPILAGIRSPRRGRKPATWTHIDRDYETLRIGMQALFHDLGITPVTLATT